MWRHELETLVNWIQQPSRKPLVIRGARQVGKSYLVREFCKNSGLDCLEINFDLSPQLRTAFLNKDVKKIRTLLEIHFEKQILPSRENPGCLLFLDEIQAAPEVFASLRYFYENFPELPVIAAGSLLDVLLKEISYSVPVGRIEYLFMGPMSFEEVLKAQGKTQLLSFLASYSFCDEIPPSVHSALLEQVRIFSLIGGMPEVVKTFVATQDFRQCDKIQKSLLLTYQGDFNKYRERVSFEKLHFLFNVLPGEVGKKFVYSRVVPGDRAGSTAKTLELLTLARVINKVYHSSGNGVPLGAEVDLKKFKVLFLDVGLVSSSLGLRLTDLLKDLDLIRVNEGALAEQWIGQQLLFFHPSYSNPELYYWVREKSGSMAEVDYLISQGPKIFPVEVKAGKGGKLKSLRIFQEEKKRSVGVRFSIDPPSREGEIVHLPLYLVNQLGRILEQC